MNYTNDNAVEVTSDAINYLLEIGYEVTEYEDGTLSLYNEEYNHTVMTYGELEELLIQEVGGFTGYIKQHTLEATRPDMYIR